MTTVNTNIIAIDGPAASGKGTLARALAEHLGYAYLDTGALYRGIAFEVLEAGRQPDSEPDALAAATRLKEKIRTTSAAAVLGNPALREEIISQAASRVASIPALRKALVDLQRRFALEAEKGAVLDGRDIGTQICPHAPVKLFVTADLKVRALRRLKELQSRGKDATHEAVLKDMRARDQQDQERTAAPLRPAEDAVILDTSDMDAQQALTKALEIVMPKLG